MKLRIEIEADDADAVEHALDEVLADFVNNGIGNSLRANSWHAAFTVEGGTPLPAIGAGAPRETEQPK